MDGGPEVKEAGYVNGSKKMETVKRTVEMIRQSYSERMLDGDLDRAKQPVSVAIGREQGLVRPEDAENFELEGI